MALPTVGSTAPPVRSAASTATRNASKSRSPTGTVRARVRVHGLELGVRAEPAAGQVDLLEIGGQEAGGLVRDIRVLDDDRRRRADGAERARGQLRPARAVEPALIGPMPPDVTEGVRELTLGENDEAPLFPVTPVELPVGAARVAGIEVHVVPCGSPPVD